MVLETLTKAITFLYMKNFCTKLIGCKDISYVGSNAGLGPTQDWQHSEWGDIRNSLQTDSYDIFFIFQSICQIFPKIC